MYVSLILYVIVLTPHMHVNAVKVFAGVFFQPLRHGIVYESSVPLVYESNYPQAQLDILEAEKVFLPNCQQADCQLSRAVKELYNATNNILMSNNQAFTSEVREKGQSLTRKTRAVEAFGDFLHFCCGTATDGELHKLQFNEERVTDHLNAFQGLVQDDHKDLVKISRNLRLFAGNFSQQFHEAYNNLKVSVESIIQKNRKEENNDVMDQLLAYVFHIYTHVNILARQEFISTAKERCQKKVLFSSVVHSDILRTDLFKLEKRYKLKGYQLAIPLNEFQRYYELPLTTCFFKDNSVVMSVKIPFISSGGQYDLFKFIPTPLYWKNQSCMLQQEEFVLAKRSDNEMQIISGGHLQDCKVQEDYMCYLPRQLHDRHMSSRCMHHILTSASLQDLQRYCTFQCSAAGDILSITEQSPTEYILSNVQPNTSIVCEDGSNHGLQQQHPGASFINLPCSCSLVENNRILIRKTYPCDLRSSDNPIIQHFLPLQWLKFNSLKIDVLIPHRNPHFSELSDIYNDKWNVTMPTLFVHDRIASDIFQKIEIPNDWQSIVNSTSFVFYVVFGWLGVLTLLCTYLAIKLYIFKIVAFKSKPAVHISDNFM